MIDIGCGTGRVSVAAARMGAKVIAIDRRDVAIRFAKNEAKRKKVSGIEFSCAEAADYLSGDDRIFDCAFVGGSQGLAEFLPVLAGKVRRRIVVNAVLLSTLQTAVATMQMIGVFDEVVQVQVSRSQPIAGSIMFRPIDPVYVIVGKGLSC
jgi:cobalt-precorrin-6B (C15)-methyltransferase